jgi:hypothetical protein
MALDRLAVSTFRADHSDMGATRNFLTKCEEGGGPRKQLYKNIDFSIQVKTSLKVIFTC